MSILVKGAQAFRKREYEGDESLMPELAVGQNPQILVIGCSDSRVDPALLWGARPGELFTVRNVANLVPPYRPREAPMHGAGVMAAVEYGVKSLAVSHIVVFGHAHCGGIAAAIDAALGVDLPEFEFLSPWLATADTVCREVLSCISKEEIGGAAEIAPLVEQRSILNSLTNLRSYPWIRQRVDGGDLALHGWWFDLDTGHLWAANPDTGVFHPLEDKP